MQECTGAAWTPIAEDAHLLRPVLEWVDREPGRVVAAHRADGRLVDVTVGRLYERIRRLAKGFIALGVQPGDRVALMSRSRVEWLEVDYAILAAQAASVPIYETSSAEQIAWIVADSGAVATVVETGDMHARYDQMAGLNDGGRPVLVIDDGDLDALELLGQGVPDAALDERMASIHTGDVATIIYTSGTTGRPKGCICTHGTGTDALLTLEAVRDMLQAREDSLVFLPLAHSMTRITTLVGVEIGARGVFTDLAHLPVEMPAAQPTMLTAVPRVFEKVYDAALSRARLDGHERLFARAAEVAVEWSRRRGRRRVGPVLAAEHVLFDRLVYRRVRAAFGGRLRFCFSGGGPLGDRLTHFFNGVGIRIFEGYGLTETNPTLTLNRADAWRPGTVGRPLAGTSIRVAPDGEILAKGPQIFLGYWGNPIATAEVFDEHGWFRTGDIGRLDEDGYLRITGRKKELLVTAAGKNVAPAPLEDRIRAHPLVSQAVVVGDARPFIGALITLDEPAARQWAAEHGANAGGPLADLAAHPGMRAELQAAVDRANLSVSRAESVREFAVLPRDLSIEAGELTPTLKVRRTEVVKGYADVIESLYAR